MKSPKTKGPGQAHPRRNVSKYRKSRECVIRADVYEEGKHIGKEGTGWGCGVLGIVHWAARVPCPGDAWPTVLSFGGYAENLSLSWFVLSGGISYSILCHHARHLIMLLKKMSSSSCHHVLDSFLFVKNYGLKCLSFLILRCFLHLSALRCFLHFISLACGGRALSPRLKLLSASAIMASYWGALVRI